MKDDAKLQMHISAQGASITYEIDRDCDYLVVWPDDPRVVWGFQDGRQIFGKEISRTTEAPSG